MFMVCNDKTTAVITFFNSDFDLAPHPISRVGLFKFKFIRRFNYLSK